jgi:hypothetical protein
MLLSGVQFGTHLDSRLTHAGMTDFEAAGNQPTDLENRKWLDSRRPHVLGEEIADERAIAKGHVVANVIAAFE